MHEEVAVINIDDEVDADEVSMTVSLALVRGVLDSSCEHITRVVGKVIRDACADAYDRAEAEIPKLVLPNETLNSQSKVVKKLCFQASAANIGEFATPEGESAKGTRQPPQSDEHPGSHPVSSKPFSVRPAFATMTVDPLPGEVEVEHVYDGTGHLASESGPFGKPVVMPCTSASFDITPAVPAGEAPIMRSPTADCASSQWQPSVVQLENSGEDESKLIPVLGRSNTCVSQSSNQRSSKWNRRSICDTKGLDRLISGLEGTSTSLAKKMDRRVFPDRTEMSTQVLDLLCRPECKESDRYTQHGLFQSIARSALFEQVTLGVIFINSLWLAIDADHNHAVVLHKAHPVFQIAEHGFCAYFCVEWLIRFLAFARKAHVFKDAWFIFDTSLTMLFVLETWVFSLILLIGKDSIMGSLGDSSSLRLVRLVRLVRTARMARLLRLVPELLIMIKGIAAATRSVLTTLLLLVLIIYVFAIVLRHLCDGIPIGDKYFPTIPDSMASLLLHGVLPDLASFTYELGEENFLFAFVLMTFVLVASLTVMNMLVGVLVEVVSSVAHVENEQFVGHLVRDSVFEFLRRDDVDLDGDHEISQVEFEKLLLRPEAAKLLQEIGVDVLGLVNLSDFIFQGGQCTLTHHDFFTMLLQLRGTNAATVKDVVDMRKFMMQELLIVEASILSHIDEISSKRAQSRC